MNRGHLPRSLLPLALITLGIWLTSGCIYVPMFGRPLQGNNAAKQVGSQTSSRPIRLNEATREQVVRVLGQPYAQLPDGTALAYTWRVQNGFTVWPLCFSGYSVDGQRTLVLRFDESGLLRSTQFLKSDQPLIQLPQALAEIVPLPPDFPGRAAPGAQPTSPPPPRGTPYRTEPGP
jgi:hypothetical protein